MVSVSECPRNCQPRPKPPPKLDVVVDFSVVNERGLVLATHRLGARFAEIDNVEPAMGKSGHSTGHHDRTIVVRSAMGNKSAHHVELALNLDYAPSF